jgi:hypothetical protein
MSFPCRLLAALWLLATGAQALTTTDLGTVAVEPPAYALHMADATDGNPATTRDALQITRKFQFSNPTTASFSLRLIIFGQYTLADADVDWQTSAGPSSAVIVPYALNMVGGVPQNVNLVARLTPVGPIPPGDSISVRAVLEEFSGGTWNALSDLSLGPYYLTRIEAGTAGDASLHINGITAAVSLDSNFMIDNVAGKQDFQASSGIFIQRYEEPANTPTTANFQIQSVLTLTDTTTNLPVPLLQNTFITPASLPSHDGQPLPAAAYDYKLVSYNFRPAAGTRLVPNHDFKLRVVASLIDATGTLIPTGTLTTTSRKLLQLSGAVVFGDATLKFTDLTPPLSWNFGSPYTSLPGIVKTELALPAGAGHWIYPGYDFGNVGLKVNIDAAGIVYVETSEVNLLPLTMPNPLPYSLNGISYDATAINITTSGLRSNLRLKLPAGCGLAVDATSRRLAADITLTDVPVTPALVPSQGAFFGITAADVRATLGLPFAASSALYFSSEEYPVRLKTDRVRWYVNTGIVRVDVGGSEYIGARDRVTLTNLANLGVIGGAESEPVSNLQVWEHAAVSGGLVNVTNSTTGGAKSTTAFTISAGEFRPHFPLGGVIGYTGGQVTMNAGVIDRVASTLTGVTDIQQFYSRTCGADPCVPAGAAAQTGDFIYQPTAQTLNFTSDGGLSGAGTLRTPHQLALGLWNNSNVNPNVVQTVHQISTFAAARYLMAGHRLPSLPVLPAADGEAASLLYSGHGSPTAPDAPDRPGTPAYLAGLGDYAGYNFRVGTGSVSVTSRIAREPLGPLTLKARCKYYTRPAGVTGMIQPATFAPRFFPLYGIPTQLTAFQLAFIDNKNTDSYVNGALTFPGPAGFALGFDRMAIKCSGDLERADLAPGQANKRLAYWGVNFDPLALAFTAGDCLANGIAPQPVISLVASLPGVTGQKLSGTLSFDSAGDIAPGPTGELGKLTLPSNLKLKGPGTSEYALRPVTGFSLNRWLGGPHTGGSYSSGLNGQGFGSFFTTIDVPYFEDMKAQVHVQTAQATAPWFVMSGTAMQEGGRSAFELQYFDTAQRCYPGNNLGLFREPDAANENYAPLAEKTWLGFLRFSYPMVWDAPSRVFLTPSWLARKIDLKVLELRGAVDRLSPVEADLSFGASYSGLPRINTKALVSDAFEQGEGLAQVVQAAATKALQSVGQGFAAPLVTGSVDQLDALMTDRLTRLIDNTLGQIVYDTSGTLYDQIKTGYVAAANTSTGAINYLNGGFNSAFNDVDTGITSALVTANDGVNDVSGVLTQIDATLLKSSQGIGEVRKLLQRPPGIAVTTPRQVFSKLINEVVKSPQIVPQGKGLLAGVSNVGQGVVDSLTAALRTELLRIANDAETGLQNGVTSGIGKTYRDLLSDAEPTLTSIDEQLANLQDFITDLRSQISGNTGPLITKIRALLTDAASYQVTVTTEVKAVKEEIRTQLLGAIQQGHQWFEDHPRAEIQLMLRRRVVDGIMGSGLLRQVQTIVRQELKKVETEIQGALDQLFAEVNRIIKPLVREALAVVYAGLPLGDIKTALAKKAGALGDAVNTLGADLRGTIGSGEINGHASITDESLRRLRLDGKFSLLSGKKSAPGADAPKPTDSGKDTIILTAFFEINEADSVGPKSCGVAAGSGPEIAFGAACPIVLPIPKPGSPTQKINGFAEARIALSGGPIPLPTQLSGKVGFKGELALQELKIIDPMVVLAFGSQENYIGAKVRAKLTSVDIAASLFVGQVCNYSRLKGLDLIDKDTIRYFDSVGFLAGDTMIGLYAGGEGRKNLIEGPETCLLKLVGGIGVGTFVFVTPNDFVVGARFMASVEGEVLCLARVKGELGLAGGIRVPIGANSSAGSSLADAVLSLVGRLQVAGEVGFCPFCIGFDKTFGVVLIISRNTQSLKIDL